MSKIRTQNIVLVVIFLLSPIAVIAQSVYPGQYNEKMKVKNKVEVQAESFNLQDVRLLPGRFHDNMMRDSAWMVSIGVDQLLHSFRTTAGIYSGREGGYMTVRKLGGWESLDCELRGHITGHLLSAYALMYAATGSHIFKLKGDSLIVGLSEVQSVFQTGYLSAFPEELINRNIRGTNVWAPWYTLHKLLSGLIDQYLYADNKQALQIAIKFGDWAYNKLAPLSEETRRKMIRNEFGGINESFYNLYALTGNEHYYWLAGFFYHNDVIEPLKDKKDELVPLHTNTFIPKVLAEARNYELTSGVKSKELCEFFWYTMVDKHTFAPGCSSDKEHFFAPSEFSKHISGYTGETCCTYNMLKLSRHLFCWNASSKVADYYERALYNHILGQQDPQTGMVAYFLPLLSGAHKVYSTPENSFWCCVGSGFESHAKYAEAIYYHRNENLFVNLFIPSELNWKEKGLKLRQETDIPNTETTRLILNLKTPTRLILNIRYPKWSGKVTLKINGKKLRICHRPGTYIKLSRLWRNGDCIEVTYPMNLYVESTPDNPQKGAVIYGPIVLAGLLGTEGMKSPAPYSNSKIYNDYYTYDYRIPQNLPVSLKYDPDKENLNLKRIPGKFEFINENGVKMIPLYEAHRQRYVVYWDLLK